MRYRSSIGTIAIALAFMTLAGARADDASKYPDLKGWWVRIDTSATAPVGIRPNRRACSRTRRWFRNTRRSWRRAWRTCRRAGQQFHGGMRSAPAHAADHDRLRRHGILRHARDHLYPAGGAREPCPPDLHRRTRLAQECGADAAGLFDRHLARRRRQRPLRRARGRDPQFSRTAHVRIERHAPAPGQSKHHHDGSTSTAPIRTSRNDQITTIDHARRVPGR